MQWRIGQHHPKRVLPRRDGLGNGRTRPTLGDHDRAFDQLQHAALGCIEYALSLCQLQRVHHHGKRLFYPELALTQPQDRFMAQRVTCQMETTQAFHGQNRTFLEHAPGCLQRLVPFETRFPRYFEPDLRPTGGTGYGLGMEAPVQRVLIFCRTVGAEREVGHGRVGPVIGDIGDDCEARATIGAVNEGVPVAPVVRIVKLPPAIRAEAHIGRNRLVRPGACGRGQDLEPG